MKEKMEEKLRKIRIEEMQAMEMLLKEDQKIEKLELMNQNYNGRNSIRDSWKQC